MTDSLADLISNHTDLNGTEEQAVVTNESSTEQTEGTVEETQTDMSINLILFTDFLTKYKDDLNQINVSKVSPKREGVIIDNSKNALLMVKESDGEDDKRELYLVKDANKIKVPDMRPSKIIFFSNDLFKIIYDYNQTFPLREGDSNFFIKAYNTKANLVCSYCVQVSANDVEKDDEGNVTQTKTRDFLVPYYAIKVKKEQKIPFVTPPENMTDILMKDVDIEAVILNYKQAVKIKDSVKTNMEAIDWLISRQESAIDVNHQLLIDKIVLDIVLS